MAAAYAALVSLLNNLELIRNHPPHSLSFDKDQITTLCENVNFLIDFMASYDSFYRGNKEGAQILERQIVCAAHAAEDVIESHVVDQIRAGKPTSCFLLDLQKEIDDMDFLRRKAIKVQKAQPTYSAAATTSSTPPTSDKNNMIGFDDVLLQLIDMLIRNPSRQVIPIVGTGGIGKTTLAKNAFEHPIIVRHFDVFLWATISQQFVVEEILKELLYQVRKSTSGSVDALGEDLYKSLYGRRYLIILDDMWSVEAWDKIKFFFPNTSNGSRVVVTSRQSDVADHLGCLWRLTMNFLDENKSWDLFCQKAFSEQDCPREFEDIGKKIVNKCKGLPLAIVVVGGHLRKSSMTREYWENVANHMNSILIDSEDNNHLFHVLSLSYSYLPIHLKPCFLYMGTFREDQKILVSDLVKLWIAEGFLKLNASPSLEEIAKGYLKDLIARNLILVDKLSLNGKMRSCKIHDILRELCIKISQKEKLFYVLDHTRRALDQDRRVVINQRIPDEKHNQKIFHALKSSAPLVRSLKYKGGQPSFDMKLIRVVNEVDRANEVGELFVKPNYELVNLRYLKARFDYKNDRSIYLPRSISLLWNLQTITISVFPSIIIAPYEIWEMIHLRHLQIRRVCLSHLLPSDRLVLQNLQIVLEVQNFRLSEEVCKRIPNIKELEVRYNNFGSECDEPKSYYSPHNLGSFQKLESLACRFIRDSRWREFALCLTFPSSLKSLSLNGSHLRWEELTAMVGSLPHLEILELDPESVIGSKWTPVEGKFLRLNTLKIHGCYDLIFWNANRFHFPVLKNLVLVSLRNLDEFPSGIGEIATLEHIELHFCKVSLAISAMRVVVEQEEEHGNESLQLWVHFGQHNQEELESFNKKLEEESLRSNNLHLHGNLYMNILEDF